MQASSKFQRAKASFGIAIAIFAIGVIIENTLHAFQISGVWELLDNIVCGLLIGIVVFVYEQRQHKKTLERLHVIVEMNHHVRNALQPILYASNEILPQEEQMRLIRNSVDRIQWALTEVLPGELREQMCSEATLHPPKNAA